MYRAECAHASRTKLHRALSFGIQWNYGAGTASNATLQQLFEQ